MTQRKMMYIELIFFSTGLVYSLEGLDAIEIKTRDIHFDDHPIPSELPDDLDLPRPRCGPLD